MDARDFGKGPLNDLSGRVFRRDTDDATQYQFHQIEGLVVGKNLSQ